MSDQQLSCNLVFGRTGCGKTSLKNMICGGEPEPDSLTSGTTDAQIIDVSIAGRRHLYLDTAGILDTRGDGEELKQSRADKVNAIGALLKQDQLQVGRVFYCVASTERLLKEEIDWLADIIQMLGGQTVMQVFSIVLTKVDAGFQKKKFEKDFDNHELVTVLRAAFPNCPVVTSGYDNIDSVLKLMVTAEESHAFVVKPQAIRTVIPKADLETQLEHTRAQLAAVTKAIAGKGRTKEEIKNQLADLEREIDDLQERIANAGWWCPGAEIEKANQRIRQCRALMRDLKNNDLQSEEDKKKFEIQKQKLIGSLEEAEQNLREKKGIAFMFMKLLS